MHGVQWKPFNDLNLTSTETLIIKFGTSFDLAIDNITFTATPVPEPSTYIAGALALLPFGLQGIRALRNRKA
jgi:hypothetical protein